VPAMCPFSQARYGIGQSNTLEFCPSDSRQPAGLVNCGTTYHDHSLEKRPRRAMQHGRRQPH
jgi:hypothetical protein